MVLFHKMLNYLFISEKKDSQVKEVYDVECLMKRRTAENGNVSFLVRWEGYGPEDDTWEEEDDLPIALVKSMWPPSTD